MSYWSFGFVQIREFHFSNPFLLAVTVMFNLTLIKVGIDDFVLQFLVAFFAIVRASS